MSSPDVNISTSRHPEYMYNLRDWSTWRWIWEGGDGFTRQFLQQYTNRESAADYEKRREITPVPGFAKAALVDIKNAVFHRMGDIVRRGGSQSYQAGVNGQKGGVDRRGSSMNHFIGTQVLPEMLAMGRCGVFVDNIAPDGPTLADSSGASPYLYMYPVEDILSWTSTRPEDDSEYQAILLKDWCIDYETSWGQIKMPKGRIERYRLVYKEDDGSVWYQFFDSAGLPINPDGSAGGTPQKTGLTKIPFVMFDIGDSLFKDIATHQIALLNLVSSDVSYALKSNFPFYTEQVDSRSVGSHLKSDIMSDGTSTGGGQGSADNEIKVGTVDGRTYDIKAERPGFISPSSEPLKASMELQRKLEDDIRKLVNLAVVSLGNSRASGEARNMDNQGLEAGLAFIGLVLEGAERKLGEFWNSYEGTGVDDTIVKYPEQYGIRSNTERINEADKLTDLMFSIPGHTVKKELAKDAVTALLGGRTPVDKLTKIYDEIDKAPYATSDPQVIQMAKEQMLASDETLSNALGFDGKKEIAKAKKDHEDRIERIQSAQASALGADRDPQAQGNPELSGNPDAGKEERGAVNDTTTKDSTKTPTRGKQQKLNGAE